MSNTDLPPLQLHGGDTFFLDNSRYESILHCDRKSEYQIVRRQVGAGIDWALFLGGAIHLCMKFRYLFYPQDIPLPTECTYKQHQILDQLYHDRTLPIDEYRTPEFAKAVIRGYNEQHPTEETSIPVRDSAGDLLVEKSFSVPLGEINGKKIVWIGRIDDVRMRLTHPNRVMIRDHKTSSRAGDYFAQDYFKSSQMQGYIYAARTMGIPARGVELNALITRKPTRTGKGTEFQRFYLEYDDETILAWQQNTLALIADFFHNHKRRFFPERTTQCVTRWGKCMYYDTCLLAPEARLQHLYGPEFEEDVWSPHHEDGVDLNAIYAAPIPPDFEMQVNTVKPQGVVIDPTQLIHEILEQANRQRIPNE